MSETAEKISVPTERLRGIQKTIAPGSMELNVIPVFAGGAAVAVLRVFFRKACDLSGHEW